MSAPELHPEVLPPEQAAALRALGPVARREGFYLGGGTALAIHLGHRRSLDFDWFAEGDMGEPEETAARIREAGIPLEVRQTGRGILHGAVDGLSVSFHAYRYPLMRPLVPWEEYGCLLASIEDIACMKLAVAAQRGARKDFIDVFALGRSGFTLERMLELFRAKYELRDAGHVLVALTYFDDADREPMPAMLWKDDWATVKAAISGWVGELAV